MILKGNQRGGGADIAAHLLAMRDNDHVALHELRGFASETLKDAMAEVEAISSATRCDQYLFSLSLNPPPREQVSTEAFEQAIERIEGRLGLNDQPRAIVFHEKNGRRHAHCVWSRIDIDKMTARPLSFFKNRLTELSRELYLEFGWQMPHGLIASEGRNPTNFTLAEWQQAKRLGQDPRWLKQVVQDCWSRSDNRAAFERGLSEHALFLCRGDRRGFVLVDHMGEVYALSRQLGLKSKDVVSRLGKPTENDKSVEATRKVVAKLLAPAMRRHIAESKATFQKRKEPLDHKRDDMVRLTVKRAPHWPRVTATSSRRKRASAPRARPRGCAASGTGSLASTSKCAARTKPRRKHPGCARPTRSND